MTINRKILLAEAKDYFFLTLGLFLYAFAFTIFLMPYETVAGGVTGMSAIIMYATGFKIEKTYMIINVILLIPGIMIMGWKFFAKTIYAIVALYLILKLAAFVIPEDPMTHLPVKLMGEGQAFMSLVIGCSLTGTSLAIVFLNNGSTGGTDIIAACVNKFHNISLGRVILLIDIGVIGSCMLFPEFGTLMERAHKVVFGFCTMVIETFMLDYVFNRQRESVQFLIFSKKYEEIGKAIERQTERSMTLLDGHGWYTGKPMKVICLLCKKYESQTVFRLIKMIDPNAFVSQSSVIGVYGEGFDEMKVRIKQKHKDEHALRNEQQT